MGSQVLLKVAALSVPVCAPCELSYHSDDCLLLHATITITYDLFPITCYEIPKIVNCFSRAQTGIKSDM